MSSATTRDNAPGYLARYEQRRIEGLAAQAPTETSEPPFMAALASVPLFVPSPNYKRVQLPGFGDATDIVFVDDQRVNFAGANELGIETIWFDPTNVADSIARTTIALYRFIER
jgi:hypothetical protein